MKTFEYLQRARDAKAKELEIFERRFEHIITEHTRLVDELAKITREANQQYLIEVKATTNDRK